MNYLLLIIPVVIFFINGVRIVRHTQRGLIKRPGKYHNFANLKASVNFKVYFRVKSDEEIYAVKTKFYEGLYIMHSSGQ